MSDEIYVCGTGGWTGPLPGDPDNNSILTATPAFGGIDISVTYPATNPHAVAHILLYRALLDNFDAALLHTVMAGNFFYDKINSNTRYYYWIKIVSVNGTVGEPIGPATAVARPAIDQVIEQLTGQIDAGQLAQSLKAKLDQISVLGAGLLDEITARENGEVTLAEALQAVDAGVAEALNFVHTEIQTRADSDAALAESINVTASTLGSDFAAVTQTMQTHINTVAGEVQDIGALYTAQVNVNGLVGGFGVYNDGTLVEAGFDVDRFWIGRTGPDKKKPFIISDGQVFINDAVIQSLVFHKLRADDGSFLFEAGKLGNSYLAVNAAQSTNFLTGVSGWRLQPNGNAEFASGNFRGDITGSTGAFSGTLTAGVVDMSRLVGVSQTLGPGTHMVEVPNDSLTHMRVTLNGAGGGGGGGGGGADGGGGGGGGRGEQIIYNSGPFTVGQQFTINVGYGGAGGGTGVSAGSSAQGTVVNGAPGVAGGATTLVGLATAGGGQPGGPGYYTADNQIFGGSGGAIGGTNGTPGSVAYWDNGEQSGITTTYGTPGIGGPSMGGAGGGGNGGYATFDSNNNMIPHSGGVGGPGRAIVEFFNPQGVVIRSEWNRMITVLANAGIFYTYP